MSLYFVIAGIFACVLLSGFFSGSEMAYSSCNQVRLENLRDDGSKRAGVALKLCEHYDDTLSAILIGNNLVNIAASSLGVVLVNILTGGDGKIWLSTLIITVLIIVFGETIPKITAKKNANVLSIKGGIVEGKVQTVDALNAFGELPSKNALVAQVLGTFLAPISSLAFVIDQIRQQKEGPAPAEA